MFNKPSVRPEPETGLSSVLAAASSEPAPAPARKAAAKGASVISGDITLEGNLVGQGEVQIDGVVRGDVTVARLTIGENGQVEGSIHAELAEVRGRVVGTITAPQVRLYATAHLDGDVTHEQLTIEAGAFFQGRSLRLQRAIAPQAGGEVIDLSAAG